MSESFESPKLVVTHTLPRDPRLHVRDHGKFMNETLREAAHEHLTRHIPRHFEGFAAAKYGYAKRSRKYQQLKDRLGFPPLVSPFSLKQGREPTRTAVMRNFKVTATQKKSTLSMRFPFAGGSGRLRLTGNGLTSPQQTLLRTRSELEVIAADEQRYLNEFVNRRYAERANAPGVKYRVRTGG